MKEKLTYVLLIILMALVGCQDRSLYENSTTKSVVDLNFAVVNGGSSLTNDQLKSIRIIGFHGVTKSVVYNDFIESGSVGGNFKLSILPGEYDFLIVANETTLLTSHLNTISNSNQLEDIVFPTESLNSTDFVFVHKVDNVIVRGEASSESTGEVSLDGGLSWRQSIPLELKRIVAQVSLELTNEIEDATKNITIVGVTICNIPRNTSLMGGLYTETDFVESNVDLNSSIILKPYAEEATPIFSNNVISEHLLKNPNDNSLSTCIKITALYNGSTVNYITYLGKWNSENDDYENFNVLRNTHYKISASITSSGVFVNDIVMSVMPWTEKNCEINFDDRNFSFYGYWIRETDFDPTSGNVIVSGDGYIEYRFSLNKPKGGVWRAQITNSLDFEFDRSEGFVSSGIASNMEQVIRIKPRRKDNAGASTSFYIVANNMEIAIDGLSETGAPKRFKIVQK